MAKAPLQQRRIQSYFFWFSAFLVAATLYFAREVFIPVALAVLFTFLLTPLSERLEKWGVNRITSVAVTGAFSLLCFAGVLVFVGAEFQKLSVVAPVYQREFLEKVRSVSLSNDQFGSRFEEFANSITEAIAHKSEDLIPLTAPSEGQIDMQQEAANEDKWELPGTDPAHPIFTRIVAERQSPFSRIWGSAGIVLGPLGTAGLVAVFTIFLLLYRDDLRDRVVYLFSTSGNFIITTTALKDASQRVSRYIVAQSILNASYALVITIGLFVIGFFSGNTEGFPNPILWGFLCGLLRFIPYAGPVVGAAFPLIVSLAAFEGYGIFMATLAFIIVLELVSNNVLEPWVYGSSTGLSSVAIIVAAVFWSWLWGPVGLLLSTPLTVCLVVFGKYVPQLETFSILLGDETSLPTPIRFYQRLLTGERSKAERLFDQEVSEKGIIETSDDLLLPAIRRIRRDYANDRLTGQTKQKIISMIKEIVNAQVGAMDEKWKAAERVARQQRQEMIKSDNADQSANVNNSGVLPEVVTGESALADSEQQSVFYIPTHDTVEESMLLILGNSIKSDRVQSFVVSTRRLPSDIVEHLQERRPKAVVLGVIPPGGLLQAEFLIRQIRENDETVPIVVAYLARVRNFDRLLRRLRSKGASYLTTTLEQTNQHVQMIVDELAEPTGHEQAPRDFTISSITK